MRTLQWVARLSGLALFLMVLAIAVGEGGPPNPLRQPWPVAIELVLMFIMWLGLIVAWRWEVLGAIMTLAGLIGFNIVELSVNAKLAGGAFPLFAIPPVLYLAHALAVRLSERPHPPHPVA